MPEEIEIKEGWNLDVLNQIMKQVHYQENVNIPADIDIIRHYTNFEAIGKIYPKDKEKQKKAAIFLTAALIRFLNKG